MARNGDTEEALKKLQRANEDRWSQLQELHRLCVELSHTNCDATASTFLQAERNILVQRGTANRECYASLDELESRHSGEDRFGAELLDRCNELQELEPLLQEKIRFQDDRMQTIEYSIKEQKFIQKKLRQYQNELNRVHGPDNFSDNAAMTTDQQDENERLRGDLAYLAGLVAPTTTERNTTEHLNSWNLNELMIRLLERYMTFPDEPYLSCRDGNIQKKHVEILKKSLLIDTFDHDENMIRLRDYTQTE